MSTIWDAWKDYLFLLQFYTKVFENLRVMTIAMSDDADCPQRPEVEKVKDEAITKTALEIAARLMTVNPAVDVIHPGNFTQFKIVLPEYNV